LDKIRGFCREFVYYGVPERLNSVVKVKVKFILEQASKAQMGSRGIAPLFL
jgi:hypothetical protein